jgi:hypothetical protein
MAKAGGFHTLVRATGVRAGRLTNIGKITVCTGGSDREHARVVSPSTRTHFRTWVVAPTEWTCMEVE